jgi:UPF0755 protein
MVRRRWLVLAACGLLVVGSAVFEARRRLAPVAPEAPEVLFTVAPGAPLGRVARELASAGLVRDALAFEWLARVRGLSLGLRAGEYRLRASLTPAEILEALSEGRVATYPLIVPEGFTAAQIGSRLAAAGLAEAAAFASAVEDPRLAAALGVPARRLEGYLFPETYQLPRGLSAERLAEIMVQQFQQVWAELTAAGSPGSLSLHEVVTLASIVEKETGVPSERPLIASVFLNRLARRMRLESDPTVIYGIPGFDGNLRRRDLENEANPYNTYRIVGLPPGPIASPGRAALAAVLQPEPSGFLYFVSRNDGSHVFAKSYREHVNNVNHFQRRARR